MAILLDVPTEYGFTVSYWRVVRVLMDPQAGAVGVVVAGYANRAARLAGKQPLKHRTYEFHAADAAAAFGDARFSEGKNPRQLAYERIKVHPDFTGGTDDADA